MDKDQQLKMFSGDQLLSLAESAEEASKLVFENTNAEIALSMFLLVRKAFNDAYDKIKDNIKNTGELTIGEAFSGITGAYVRGSHTERGGSKYTWMPTGGEKPEEVGDELMTIETVYRINSAGVDKYVKKFGELPPGIQYAKRNKSLSLTPTKEARALFDERQLPDSMLYDISVPEITGEEESQDD